MRERVLLGHLNSNGDCLFATVVARQIKEVDHPGCHLTWAVNSACKQSVLLNPNVDAIWEIPTERAQTSEDEWAAFVSEVEKKTADGEFDRVFLTQIIGDNWLNYDGGIRSSTYNNYPHDITVSYQPVLCLSGDEVDNVRRFADEHELSRYEKVVLVECAAASFETALNPASAYELALDLVNENDQLAFILSSNKTVASRSPAIMDASVLTFRENAELTKYCDLFVGCASGISWLTTTDWAKQLNKVLVINQDLPVFPSMIYDHEYISEPVDHIIEMRSDEHTKYKLKACVKSILTDGFADTRAAFNEKIRLHNYSFLDYQLSLTLPHADFGRMFSSLKKSIRRNGARLIFTPQVARIILSLPLRSIKRFLKLLGLKTNNKLINQNK